ncbi:hypothetical protein SUGI_0995570 [Cryptomeria japonica]|uniref:uncharacterized protein LOC131052621 isoform X2 n=1 Tax=Cryptomeria japonica TaxID=3369 RepID=UPI0024147063|nr:uncharacterized protein LOC131052621 isoform X2 [Cryptomeria japonica]GLJ47153.1 hypothetical protein SUGI_0995570 [Cryptomeria japonica]
MIQREPSWEWWEYEYPTTGKDEPIPVVSPSEPIEKDGGAPPAPGEDLPSLSDKDIQRMEEMEQSESGVWSEDMAENKPRPGEVEDPDLKERLPSDRG